MTVFISDQPRPVGSPCSGWCRLPEQGSPHCHCSVCHCTFRNESTFKDHRSDGYCLDPAEIGLEVADEMWATPEGHAQRVRLAESAAVRRSQGAAGRSGAGGR